MARAQAIPRQMRAAAIDHFGSLDAIHIEQVPVPKLGKRDILVEVATAGVGEWEADRAEGAYQDARPKFPRVLGSDGAGTVVATGDAVERFSTGDRVYGWALGNPKAGFFAEYTPLHESEAAIIPDNITFDEAGALAVAGITALQGLEALELAEGQNVIIFGASGGVGHVALQLAKIAGLRVFAVASKSDGVRLVNKLGADGAAEGHSATLMSKARAFAPNGYAGALVLAGGSGWKRELEMVKRGGRVACPNGVDAAPTVPRGVTLRMYDAEESPREFDRLNEMIAQGPFQVVVSKKYSLEDAAKAIEDVQQHHLGKFEITV